MTRIRVLSVIHAPAFGGAHNQLLQLHEPLSQEGIDVIAVLPDDAEASAARLEAAGVKVHLIEIGRLRATVSPRIQTRFASGLRGDLRRLRAVIAEERADVVQCHGITNPQAALAARREGAAVVWQLFDTRAPMALRRAFAPLFLRLTDAMTVWGEGLVRAHPGTSRLGSRIVTVYPPVDTVHFAPDADRRDEARIRLEVRPDAPLVGTVGVVNPQKGHGGLIAAAGLLAGSHPDLETRIIGAPSPAHTAYRDRLEKSITANGLDGKVRFVDPMSQVRDLVVGLDVFAMPSVPRSEGMPTAILEAMACGIPVVATRVGATDELVRDGVTGLLVPPEDSQALADAIARLLDNPGLREAFGEAARKDALERFDLAALAGRHAGAYRLALQHRDGAKGREKEVLDRERDFFDEGAGDLDPSQMPPREYEPYESRFEDALIEQVGDLSEKRILDLGCGTGDLTLRLLQRGASVTALDLSPGAVNIAAERARLFVPDGDARFVTGTAEESGLPDEEFDFVVGKLVLHHLDLSRAAPEIRRVLKPGGGAAFIETSGFNRVLRVARRHLPGRAGVARYGTPDEHPLTPADIEFIGRHFTSAVVDFPVMVLAYLVERHVFRWRLRGTQKALASLDHQLARSARARRGSYYLRLTLER